ncbi:hypothetical protein Ancab_002098 [Ancistrocladus abbreviatus]
MEGLQASFLFALVFPLVLLKIILSAAKKTKPNLNLPPSPPKLPFIGNVHQLGKDPFASIAHFAEKLGPICSFQLGEILLVVVSSPTLAREVLKTQDLTFCSRQQFLAFRELSYNGTSVSFSPYGSYWRYTKKILTTEVLSVKRVREYEFARKEQLCRLVQRIATCYPKTTNLTKMLARYTNDVICSAILGRNFSDDGEYDRHGFHEMIRAIDQVALDGFSISEYFPSMELLHILTGYKSKVHKLFRRFDNFFNGIIEEHLDPKKKEKREMDLLDVLLNIQKDQTSELALTMNNVKAIVTDMFISGTSSASVVLNNTMMELFLNPKVMKQAQEEVRSMVGERKFVLECDLSQLQYLKAVVKETLRLHPCAPFLVPRESMEAAILDGHHIPAKAEIWVNVGAIARDPKTWKDPEVFNPDRFIANNIDFKGQDFEFLPFGAGRRICPAISLASVMMELALAQLLHAFDWEIPSGTNEYLISTGPISNLVVAAKPRFDFA